MNARATLTDFLLGRGPPPPVETLRAARVAGYAYLSLPDDHPLRPALREDHLRALMRHHRVRRELLPLVAAWRVAGVEALLFKGFHLAEFVYPAPGARRYGDVDVLIRPGTEVAAAAVAEELGWTRSRDPGAPDLVRSHAIFGLRGPEEGTALDVHRYAVHAYRWSRVPRRVTDSVWEASRVRDWEGTLIREMHAVDALLVGLILQRAWSGDSWGVKAADPLDFRAITAKFGTSREELAQRARELGCTRTLAAFLRRCDPDAGRLVLRRPTLLRRWALDLAVAPERLPRRVERIPDYLKGAAKLAPDVPSLLRDVLRAKRALAADRELPRLLESLTPAASRPSESAVRRTRIVRLLRRLVRLFPTNPRGDCLVRSLAIYSALRREGWPAEFVTGVRREGGVVVGHAWIELDGRVLPELGEPRNRVLYRETFRFPPVAARNDGD